MHINQKQTSFAPVNIVLDTQEELITTISIFEKYLGVSDERTVHFTPDEIRLASAVVEHLRYLLAR